MARPDYLPPLKTYRKVELCIHCYIERGNKEHCCGEADFERHYYSGEFRTFIDVNDSGKMYDSPNEATAAD